jgi:hypothetical protein
VIKNNIQRYINLNFALHLFGALTLALSINSAANAQTEDLTLSLAPSASLNMVAPSPPASPSSNVNTQSGNLSLVTDFLSNAIVDNQEGQPLLAAYPPANSPSFSKCPSRILLNRMNRL